MNKRWLYECALFNEATGERRLVVVQLSNAERLNALRAFERGLAMGYCSPSGPGGPDGMIVKAYALQRAESIAPAGFHVIGLPQRRPELAIVQ